MVVSPQGAALARTFSIAFWCLGAYILFHAPDPWSVMAASGWWCAAFISWPRSARGRIEVPVCDRCGMPAASAYAHLECPSRIHGEPVAR